MEKGRAKRDSKRKIERKTNEETVERECYDERVYQKSSHRRYVSRDLRILCTIEIVLLLPLSIYDSRSRDLK